MCPCMVKYGRKYEAVFAPDSALPANPVLRLWWRLVQFGFRLLYNELAFTYDLVSKVVSLGAWRCWQRAGLKHLAVHPGSRVLELAHGTGDLQLDLHAAGFAVFGYDLSPNMGQIASRKLRRHHCTARLTRGMAQRLPYESAAFDAVICTFPTDFILAPATLQEIYRVLAPDGQLILVVSGVFAGQGPAQSSLEFLYRITGQREATGDRFDLRTFFADFGFIVDLHYERCPRSIAQVLSARKKG